MRGSKARGGWCGRDSARPPMGHARRGRCGLATSLGRPQWSCPPPDVSNRGLESPQWGAACDVAPRQEEHSDIGRRGCAETKTDACLVGAWPRRRAAASARRLQSLSRHGPVPQFDGQGGQDPAAQGETQPGEPKRPPCRPQAQAQEGAPVGRPEALRLDAYDPFVVPPGPMPETAGAMSSGRRPFALSAQGVGLGERGGAASSRDHLVEGDHEDLCAWEAR